MIRRCVECLEVVIKTDVFSQRLKQLHWEHEPEPYTLDPRPYRMHCTTCYYILGHNTYIDRSITY